MIKRKLFSRLEKHLSSDQMTVIVGPRQVGKTYLMNVLKDKLEKENQKTVWLNLDNEEDKTRFASQANLLSYLDLLIGAKRKAFVFIDEIQRKENAGLFLKGIYDRKTPFKFIISGSGSLELKARIPESMAGRKQLFTLHPVSFEEFVNFRTDYRYENKLSDFFRLERVQSDRLLSEYLVFGGYPRVVLADSISQKQAEMQEIYRSYLDRDLRDLLRLEKTESLTVLLKIIGSQIGSLANISELASTAALAEKTVRDYLFYLEQTFIIKRVTPFFRNTRKEITKAPVFYFGDLGLRNWLLSLFGLPEIPPPLAGHLFENLVINILKEQLELLPVHLHFWRTRDQAEVDFILEKGLEVIPVEAKYSKPAKPEIPRSFRNFLARYAPKQGFIVHQEKRGKIKIDKTLVHLISIYDLVTSGVNLLMNPGSGEI